MSIDPVQAAIVAMGVIVGVPLGMICAVIIAAAKKRWRRSIWDKRY